MVTIDIGNFTKVFGMFKLKCVMMALTVMIAITNVHAQTNTIKVNEAKDANGAYAMAMVELALSKISRKYVIEKIKGDLTQSRNIAEVQTGTLDIMWAATNSEIEQQLLPVRIPLYKGLLGHRIFIIHPDSQNKFNSVINFDDLKRFTFGQGRTWADSQILEANGLNVVKVQKYESLFYMVDGGRFDAFPRGVQEPIGEIAKYPNLSLSIEKKIMLVYKMPFYIFSSKTNQQLVSDLEEGLNIAIQDGSFDNLFFNDPTVKGVLDNINLDDRLVFDLKNPTLPAETPVDRKELWLDINTIKMRRQSSNNGSNFSSL